MSQSFSADPFLPRFSTGEHVSCGSPFYFIDLIILLAGAIVTFAGASYLLKRIEE